MGVAGGYRKSSLMLPNGKRNTKIRAIAERMLSRNWGKIESSPGGARNTNPGPDLITSLITEGIEAPSMLPDLATLEPEKAQRYVIEMLDELRRLTEQVRYNRPRFMLLARECGLSHAEIATLLGMTEPSVRQAVKRAKDAGVGLPE